MTYDPVAYWRTRGATYEGRLRRTPEGTLHEAALRKLLASLRFESVLDVGCGWGHYGQVVRELRPLARYTGVDVSPDLLASAGRRLPDAELICADIRTWQPDRRWDLVLAASILMHIPPADIEAVVATLRRLAVRYLVTLDWDEPGPHPTDSYQFVHDYRRLLPGAARVGFRRTGIYCLAVAP